MSWLAKTRHASKAYSQRLSQDPLAATVAGTKGLVASTLDATKATLLSPAAVTKAISRKRASVWVQVALGACCGMPLLMPASISDCLY